jgi:peptide/nickel transport system ATP-binding protein/oligopeptide transport system ATP-binding protein
MSAPLLSIRGLRTTLASDRGRVTVVDGVDLDVQPGEILGLVGESGSGKSMTLRSILRLIRPPGQVTGQVLWRGRDLVPLGEPAMRAIRGREIGMIFQEPMTALNPVLSVGAQILENLAAHTDLGGKARRVRAVELLDLVGIPAPAQRVGDYPHQFSGGMRQRAMIAIALASNPTLLLADEPTTALDVTIQDQILKLLQRLRETLGMAVILVTHDLGVVAQSCDRVAVLYAGRVAEYGAVGPVFAAPRHAYTLGLLRSVPDARHARQPLRPIAGAPPPPDKVGEACAFIPRCGFATAACAAGRPPLAPMGEGRLSACLHSDRLEPVEWAA